MCAVVCCVHVASKAVGQNAATGKTKRREHGDTKLLSVRRNLHIWD